MKKYALIAALTVLGGCADGSHSAPDVSNIQLANPASVYCQQLSGKTEIVPSPAGDTGFCILPDHTRIEEWALYRRDHPTPP